MRRAFLPSLLRLPTARSIAGRTLACAGRAAAFPRWLSGFVDGQCAVCAAWSHERLCDDCRSTFDAAALRCRRCGIRVGPALDFCGECVVAPPAFASTVVAVDYAYPWADLIGRFKFGASLDLASVLASTLAQAVAGAAAAGAPPPPDLLLPVPLAAQRLRERGYNQSWELARRLSSRVGVRADASLLLRIRETAAQSALLPGERELNLRRAFAVEPTRAGEIHGRIVAVVDDVMTTGATGDEVARTLLRAGAAEVRLWVLARTPKPADLA